MLFALFLLYPSLTRPRIVSAGIYTTSDSCYKWFGDTFFPSAVSGMEKRYAMNRTVYREIGAFYIPREFDIRKAHPECAVTINTVLNQRRDDCWAYAITRMLRDRLCIKSSGELNIKFNTAEFAERVPPIHRGKDESGLEFAFWKVCGLHSHDAVPFFFPYILERIGVRTSANRLVKVKDAYFVDSNGEFSLEKEMQIEILLNGPILALVNFRSRDFQRLNDSIYSFRDDAATHQERNHVVNVIGWGIENRRKYWIIANSWGRRWGNHGFARADRGTAASQNFIEAFFVGWGIRTKYKNSYGRRRLHEIAMNYLV